MQTLIRQAVALLKEHYGDTVSVHVNHVAGTESIDIARIELSPAQGVTVDVDVAKDRLYVVAEIVVGDKLMHSIDEVITLSTVDATCEQLKNIVGTLHEHYLVNFAYKPSEHDESSKCINALFMYTQLMHYHLMSYAAAVHEKRNAEIEFSYGAGDNICVAAVSADTVRIIVTLNNGCSSSRRFSLDAATVRQLPVIIGGMADDLRKNIRH